MCPKGCRETKNKMFCDGKAEINQENQNINLFSAGPGAAS